MCRPMLNNPASGPCNVSRGSSMAPSHYSIYGVWGLRDRQYDPQSSVAHPMHPPTEEERHDRRPLAVDAGSGNRTSIPSSDELRFLRVETEETNNGLLYAREMVESAQHRAAAATEAAERSRREQQRLVERLCQL